MADISRMKIIDLKRELRSRGLKVSGKKTVLVERLQSALMMNLRGVKRQKLDQYDGECSKAVNDASAKESLSILEMPVEIMECIFDYLDIIELSAVSKTCKWMQQVARRCYRQTYSGQIPEYRKTLDGVMVAIYRIGYDPYFIDVKHFIPLFDKFIFFSCHNMREEQILYKLIDQQSEFQQLRQLTLRELDFTNFNIDTIEEVLSQLEYMAIEHCKINDAFLKNLFKLAPNIKRLYLKYTETENRWIEHNYPTLEHCEIISDTFVPITVLLTYNPNIRKFGTNLINLWKNMQLINADEINLEELAVIVDKTDHRLDDSHLRSFWQSIDKHSRQGFYKRLHLYYLWCIRFNQKIVDEIVISTAVDRFCVSAPTRLESVALSELNFLTNVVDFTFIDSRFIINIETVATKWECLKRITFGKTNLRHVKMFIDRNLKLQQIRIDWFVDEFGIKQRMKVLNLMELNKERAKLSNAKKITLFVKEPVYLATKRTMGVTDLEFIKLKRLESWTKDNITSIIYDWLM